MALREAFFRNFGTNMLSGITLGEWLRMLRENGFSVDARFWPRAILTTLSSASNSVIARIEDWRYARSVQNTRIAPPLFILGTWRSGTTHLHNLLSLDKRFAFPNLYQVTYPRTFLLT